MNMEFLLYSIAFGVGIWLGWHTRGIVFLYNISEHPDKIIESLEKIKKINDGEEPDEGTKVGTEIKIERIGDVLYAFAKEDDEFIAQGPTLSDLLEQAQKRFPGRKFFGNIPNGDSAKELV